MQRGGKRTRMLRSRKYSPNYIIVLQNCKYQGRIMYNRDSSIVCIMRILYYRTSMFCFILCSLVCLVARPGVALNGLYRHVQRVSWNSFAVSSTALLVTPPLLQMMLFHPEPVNVVVASPLQHSGVVVSTRGVAGIGKKWRTLMTFLRCKPRRRRRW
jgi:hypothetical protein